MMHTMSVSSGVGLGACLVALLGNDALAQGHGTISGAVRDEATAAALVGAAISIPRAGFQTVSASDGTFALTLAAGVHVIRVELPGYVTTTDQIEVTADEVGLVQLTLGRVEAIIEELVVRVGSGNAQGASVTEIDRGDHRLESAMDLLREQVPGLIVRGSLGARNRIRIRGSSSLIDNDPSIYVDGTLISDGGSVSAVHALERIPAANVQRIRVLRGPAAAAQFGDATRGVILVETR